MNRKALWMISVLVVFGLLSGCSLLKKTSESNGTNEIETNEIDDNTNETVKPSETNENDESNESNGTEENVERTQLSFEEYTEEAVRLRSEYSAALKAFGEVRQNGNLELDEWIEQSREKINDIRAVLDEFASIAPPDENKELDETFLVAIEEYRNGLDLFEEAMEKLDDEIDAKAVEHLQIGQDYWNYSFRVLSINNPLPIEGSDGTIDSQTLKDLDLNAGIDRDSVILNVSKDGKELVGYWGFENEDGTYNVSIAIYEDGSYEGYGNGAFPNKDNAFEGSWDWNYIKGTLTFHHTTQYSDGEKLEEGEYREYLPMEVQRFDEEGIQLFDLESWATFAYQKIDDSIVEELLSE